MPNENLAIHSGWTLPTKLRRTQSYSPRGILNFYLRFAIQERWGNRELERQTKSPSFEAAVLTQAGVSPVARQIQAEA